MNVALMLMNDILLHKEGPQRISLEKPRAVPWLALLRTLTQPLSLLYYDPANLQLFSSYYLLDFVGDQ